jgi:hypothetical protein
MWAASVYNIQKIAQISENSPNLVTLPPMQKTPPTLLCKCGNDDDGWGETSSVKKVPFIIFAQIIVEIPHRDSPPPPTSLLFSIHYGWGNYCDLAAKNSRHPKAVRFMLLWRGYWSRVTR